MIVCKDYRFIYKTEGDAPKNVIWVELYTSATPGTLPTNPQGILGFPQSYKPEDVAFAAGSTLYIVGTGDVYIADETGTFVLQDFPSNN